MCGPLRAISLLWLLIACGSSEKAPSLSGGAGRAGAGGSVQGGKSGAGASGGALASGAGRGASTAGSSATGVGGTAGSNAAGRGGVASGGGRTGGQGGISGDETNGGEAGSAGGGVLGGCDGLLDCCETLDGASRDTCMERVELADDARCGELAVELYLAAACEPMSLPASCEAVLQCCIGKIQDNVSILALCLSGLQGGDVDRCDAALDLLDSAQACD